MRCYSYRGIREAACACRLHAVAYNIVNECLQRRGTKSVELGVAGSRCQDLMYTCVRVAVRLNIAYLDNNVMAVFASVFCRPCISLDACRGIVALATSRGPVEWKRQKKPLDKEPFALRTRRELGSMFFTFVTSE
jgi:hypothetical protein